MNYFFNTIIQNNFSYFNDLGKELNSLIQNCSNISDFSAFLLAKNLNFNFNSTASGNALLGLYSEVEERYRIKDKSTINQAITFELDFLNKNVYLNSFFLSNEKFKIYISHDESRFTLNKISSIKYNFEVKFNHDNNGDISYNNQNILNKKRINDGFFNYLNIIAKDNPEIVYNFLFKKVSFEQDIIEIFKLNYDINFNVDFKKYESFFIDDIIINNILKNNKKNQYIKNE